MAMKQAKSGPAEIEAVQAFVGELVSAVHYGVNPGQDCYSDDEAYSDERLGAFVREWLKKHPGALSRVVYGYEMLVGEACDPDKTFLAWKPDIAEKLGVEP